MRARASLDAIAARHQVVLEWWPTEGRGQAEELASRAVAQGRSLVLAYGGDGTYNEVARGLLGSETAMGVLPGGTTSVLTYELGVPRPADRGLESLLAGSNRAMRVGATNHGEIFLLMLSAGPDAIVLERLAPSLKRLGGKVGVALQALVELVRPRALPRLGVVYNGRRAECGWVIVGKSRCYAGPFHATPEADPFARSLAVVVQLAVGRRAAIPFALAMPWSVHVQRPDVRSALVDSLVIEAAGREGVSYQIDGDLGHRLPVEVSIHPEPLLIRLPAGSAAGEAALAGSWVRPLRGSLVHDPG
jgi:diacylglycerol kinase (ATP)